MLIPCRRPHGGIPGPGPPGGIPLDTPAELEMTVVQGAAAWGPSR